MSPSASVTVMRLPAVRVRPGCTARARVARPGAGIFSQVPWGQWTIFSGSRSQSRSGSCWEPPTMHDGGRRPRCRRRGGSPGWSWEVGVPPPVPADLAEDLAVAEGLEGLRVAEEAVEGLVVELRPASPRSRGCAGRRAAQGAVHVGEVGALFEALRPGVGDVTVDLGQVVQRLGVVRLAPRSTDGRGRRLGEGVGERPGLQSHQVDVVLEGGGGRREAHRAHLGGQGGVAPVEPYGPQSPADLRRPRT